MSIFIFIFCDTYIYKFVTALSRPFFCKLLTVHSLQFRDKRDNRDTHIFLIVCHGRLKIKYFCHACHTCHGWPRPIFIWEDFFVSCLLYAVYKKTLLLYIRKFCDKLCDIVTKFFVIPIFIMIE